jgi:hypothetical protein
MTTADIAALRLQNQHLSHADLASPADVVRRFGAVQAQDFPDALYAIGLRMPSATDATVEHAISEKTIVRSWPMRGTIHFMPAEDARWMIRLLAPRYNGKAANNYRKAELTPRILAQAGKVLANRMSGGRQCTRQELYAVLNEAGIQTGMQGTEQRGLHVIGHWAREGLICIAARRGKQHTFALLDEWLPPGRDLSSDAAMAEIAKRYFSSHGPATLKDFAWWSGLSLTEAKRGFQPVQHDFERAIVDEAEYWFPPIERPPRSNTKQVFLLPPYDEYTIAYADRSAAIDPAKLSAVQSGLGANVTVDGRIAGTWQRKVEKDEVHIRIRLLNSNSAGFKKA